MYIAYSEVLHRTVNVNEVFDLNEAFCCPNRKCTAKLKIKGTTGKIAKHFARLPSTPHIEGCEYENGDSRYVQPELQQRSSLDDIFGDFIDPNTRPGTPTGKRTSSANSNVLRINTPGKLLKFCRMNTLTTEYLPGITVDSIIVDERNLISNSKYKGIEGLRIIVGETLKFESNKLYLQVKAVSEKGGLKYLNAVVTVDAALLRYVIKHILETQNNKFKGYKLAVFGNWTKDKTYWSSCTVENQKHIILKL